MERRGRLSLYRRIYFSALAVFFLLNLFLYADRSLAPYCHLALAGNALRIIHQQYLAMAGGTWGDFGILGLGIAWLAIILAAGGGFCSWICFFGGVDDGLSALPRRARWKVPRFFHPREFQLALLAFLAWMSFSMMEPVFCRWLCPFGPGEGVLSRSDAGFSLQTTSMVVVGAVFLVFLPLLTKKRAFCATICPFGAIPPLLRGLSPHRVTIDPEKCRGCGACVRECPSFAVDRGPRGGKPVINRFCTGCIRCQPACRNGAVKMTLFDRREGRLMPFISLALGGALSMFYVPGGLMALLGLLP